MARMQGLTLARGNRGLLVVAALAGLAAAVLFIVAVNQDNSGSTASVGGGTETAVVANQNIGYGQEVKEDMLRVRNDVPADQLVTGALVDTATIVGQRATIDIAEGEQITGAKIGAGVETGEGISWIISENRRGFAFEITEATAVGGHLLPTDHVDIIGRFRIKDAPGVADNQYILRTAYVLEDVEVVAVGEEKAVAGSVAQDDADGDGAPDSRSQLPEDVNEQPGATTVTLNLSPEEVQELFSAQGWAESLRLSARPPGETGARNLEPIDVVVTE